MKKSPSALKLLYFTGCPKVDQARALLKKAGVSFVEIRQEALPTKHPLTGYSSPTVLAGKEIIFGSETSTEGLACSVELPGLEDFKQRLKAFS